MWEAIRQNQRRSKYLLALLGSLLALFGLAIGLFLGNGDLVVGLLGVVGALVLWLIMTLFAFIGGDKMLLASSHAHQIKKEDMPQLWNVVEEMTIASGMGKMPKVYVIEDETPNAFAVGRNAETASVAVTTGLVRRLNRDELQGVIAHEIGHIRNLDVRFLTIASVTVGTIVILSDVVIRGMFFTGGRRRRSSSSGGGGQGQAILLVIVIVVAILAPIAAQALYFACSRKREYLADASGARFTRYPEGLASALDKISRKAHQAKKKVNRAVAPMYIVNPLQSMSAVGLFSTHPPTEKRIQILRSMAGGAGFANYEAAYKKIEGVKSHCIGKKTLESEKEAVGIRQASAEKKEPQKEGLDRVREVFGFLDRTAGFLLIPCACGMQIKLPPNFRNDAIKCPKCGRSHEVPKAKEQKSEKPEKKPLNEYHRKSKGWETFQCSCGQNIPLSPAFSGTHVRCPDCQRKIKIYS